MAEAVTVEIHDLAVVYRAVDLPDVDSEPARACWPVSARQRKMNVILTQQFPAHVGGVNETAMLGERLGEQA